MKARLLLFWLSAAVAASAGWLVLATPSERVGFTTGLVLYGVNASLLLFSTRRFFGQSEVVVGSRKVRRGSSGALAVAALALKYVLFAAGSYVSLIVLAASPLWFVAGLVTGLAITVALAAAFQRGIKDLDTV